MISGPLEQPSINITTVVEDNIFIVCFFILYTFQIRWLDPSQDPFQYPIRLYSTRTRTGATSLPQQFIHYGLDQRLLDMFRIWLGKYFGLPAAAEDDVILGEMWVSDGLLITDDHRVVKVF